jgi:hypothetical protein
MTHEATIVYRKNTTPPGQRQNSKVNVASNVIDGTLSLGGGLGNPKARPQTIAVSRRFYHPGGIAHVYFEYLQHRFKRSFNAKIAPGTGFSKKQAHIRVIHLDTSLCFGKKQATMENQYIPLVRLGKIIFYLPHDEVRRPKFCLYGIER